MGKALGNSWVLGKNEEKKRQYFWEHLICSEGKLC